jgi:hypothetical protein
MFQDLSVRLPRVLDGRKSQARNLRPDKRISSLSALRTVFLESVHKNNVDRAPRKARERAPPDTQDCDTATIRALAPLC